MDQNNDQQKAHPLIKQGWLRAILFLISAFISSSLFSVLGLVTLAIIFNIDLMTLMTNSRDLIKDLGLPATITLVFWGFIGMLLAAWLFRKFIDKKSFRSLGFDFALYRRDFVWGFLLGIIMISIGFLALYLSGMIAVVDTHFNVTGLIGYIIFFCIGSLNEEIMIRGYFLGNFCESINKYLALFISSIIFALLHLANANVTVLSFINIFLAGLLLGIYFIHKKNLWLPISLHFSWNFFQGAVFGFEVSGVDVSGVIVQETHGSDLWTGGKFGLEGSLVATILMIIFILVLHYQYKNKTVVAG